MTQRKSRLAFKYILLAVLATTAGAALVLGAVYRIDRAGWAWYKLTGFDIVRPETFADSRTLSAREFIKRYPYFELAESEQVHVVLKAGEYQVDQSVVIPEDLPLTIEPGTIVQFGAGRSLLSYSSVTAIGTEDAPIIFTAKNRFLKWGTFAVLEAGRSHFEHVRFQHARRANINDIDLVAGLSLFNTDAEIRNCEFVDMYGKDAVNIRDAHAVVTHSLFQDVLKDGVDMDGGSGEISYNRFINCQDEGIDLSANSGIEVHHNSIIDEWGGRVAADNNLQEVKDNNTFGYL